MRINESLYSVSRSVVLGGVGIFLLFNPAGFNVAKNSAQAASIYYCPTVSQNLFSKTDPAKIKLDLVNLKKVNDDLQDSLSQSSKVLTSGLDRTNLILQIQNQTANRKAHLIELMREDPSFVFSSILRAGERSELSLFTQNCVEAPVSVEGTLEILHADFLDGSTSEVYSLLTVNGEKLNLHPVRTLQQKKLISGLKVRINGYRLDNEVLLDPSSEGLIIAPAGDASVISAAGIPDAQGVQNTIMLLTNFSDTTISNITKAQWDDMMFNQTNNYYIKTSYNQTSIAGESFGWFNLPITQTCDSATILSASVAAADSSVDFSSYSRLVIVVPFSNCGYSGLGTIGKRIVPTQDGNINMSVAWIGAQAPSSGLFEHEFGHNLGVHHASFLNCGASTAALSGCNIVEYGDFYDVMGVMAYEGEMNAPHREYLGWFDLSSIPTVTADGTYALEPIETATSVLKALKIQRSPSDYLYIEYRQPIDNDQNFKTITGTNIFLGALLHSLQYANKSLLLDTTPPGDAITPVIETGSSFIDPATGAVINVIGATTTALTVNVKMGKTDFTPPIVSINTPLSNSTVSGTVTVSASAQSAYAITKMEYLVDGVLFATVWGGPSSSASWDTTTFANGNHWLLARAYDNSGAAWNAWGNVGTSPQVVVNVSNTDSVPPTVSITSPVNGANYTSTSVTVMAQASDDKGIYYVNFWKDNELSPFWYDYEAPYSATAIYSLGSHTVKATAVDLAGNSTDSAPVIFTVSASDSTPPVITWNKPTGGSLSTGVVTLAVTATDNVGVTKVEFYVDGVLLATDTTSPYSADWDISSVTFGSTHTLFARAYDAAGNMSESAHVSVTVNNGAALSVSFTTPLDGAKVPAGRTVKLEAVASGGAGIVKVQFFVNDTKICVDKLPPYTCSWDVPSPRGKKYTLKAKAFDSLDNRAVQKIQVTSK